MTDIKTNTVVSNVDNIELEAKGSTHSTQNTHVKDDALGPDRLPPLRILIPVISAVYICTILASLDVTIVATALPMIASSFNGFGQVAWVATSYLLTENAFQPLFGKSCDVFGRKNTAMAACVIFIIGSVLCGASWGIVPLIVSRAIQGIGGSGMWAIGPVIVADITPMKYRGAFLGSLGVAFAMLSIVGPVLGGWLTDAASWRWCFYINIPLTLIALALLAVTFKEPPHSNRETSTGQNSPLWKRIDYLGAFLMLSAAVTFMIATSLGGRERSWSDAVVIVLFVLSGVLAITFYVVETRFAVDPVMPMRIYKNRTVAVGSLLCFAAHVVLLDFIFYVPNFLQVAGGYTATQSGLYLLSFLVTAALLVFVSGVAVGKYPYYRGFIFVGFIMAVVSSFLMYFLLSPTLSVGAIVGIVLLAGMGNGLYLQMVPIAVQASIPKEDIAVCSPTVWFWGSLGGVLGLAVSDAIFSGTFFSRATAILGPEGGKILQSVEKMRSLPSRELALILEAYTESVRYVFLMAAIFAILGLLLSPFMVETVPTQREEVAQREEPTLHDEEVVL